LTEGAIAGIVIAVSIVCSCFASYIVYMYTKGTLETTTKHLGIELPQKNPMLHA
jgi:hypothetical protein